MSEHMRSQQPPLRCRMRSSRARRNSIPLSRPSMCSSPDRICKPEGQHHRRRLVVTPHTRRRARRRRKNSLRSSPAHSMWPLSPFVAIALPLPLALALVCTRARLPSCCARHGTGHRAHRCRGGEVRQRFLHPRLAMGHDSTPRSPRPAPRRRQQGVVKRTCRGGPTTLKRGKPRAPRPLPHCIHR